MFPSGLRTGSEEDSKMRNFIVLYFSLNIVWVIKFRRWAGNVATMEEGWSALNKLTGKPTGLRNRAFG